MKTYRYLFLAGWLIWLLLVLFCKHEVTRTLVADVNYSDNDTLAIDELKYAVISPGTDVEKNQLLGYNKSREEVEVVSSLNKELQQFSSFNELKERIGRMNIPDEKIRQLCSKLMKQNEKTEHPKASPPRKITRKISTNKDKLVLKAEENLKQMQQLYSERKVSLNELKQASAELTRVKAMQEFRNEIVAVPTKTVTKPSDYGNSDAGKQLINQISENIRNWFINNEIKAPTSGKLIMAGTHYAIVSINSQDSHLSFIDFGLKEESYNSIIKCNNRVYNVNAVQSSKSGHYVVKLDPQVVMDCKLSSINQINVTINCGRSSILAELVDNARNNNIFSRNQQK